MLKTRTRCADSVVRGYHVYMDKWDSAIGDKFNAEMTGMIDTLLSIQGVEIRGIHVRELTGMID